MMKRKHRRLVAVLVGLTALAGATALVLTAFQDNIMLFYSPSDLAERPPEGARSFRMGGLVEEGSVRRLDDGLTVEFRITDLAESVPVTYKGILPFVASDIIRITLLAAFPAITLWLVKLLA